MHGGAFVALEERQLEISSAGFTVKQRESENVIDLPDT